MKYFLIFLIILTGCTPIKIELIEFNKPIKVYFCPEKDCGKILLKEINNAKTTISCAFYELKITETIKMILFAR